MTPDAQRPDPSVIQPSRKPTDPVLVLVLAFFLGGISYFVVGQWQKGISTLAVWLCLLVVAVLTCGFGTILFVPVHIAIVIDAYMQAKALQEGHAVGQWSFFSNHL